MSAVEAAAAATGADVIVDGRGSAQPVLKRSAGQAQLDEDFLEITPLGGGNEVGRSCILVKFKGKTLLLDCGIHPAHAGIGGLPYLDDVDAAEVDLLLVTHFHLDHAAGVPYFLTKTPFKGKCFMTHATKSVYKLILQDYVKVSTIGVEGALYTEQDLIASLDRIDVINFHEVKHCKGVRFSCYHAGHVLGACMFLIEIAGVRILYTGDYSRQEDRHLMAAEIPAERPDVLICEGTYGTQSHEPLEARENQFRQFVRNIVTRQGRCLLPVFALGRAQELLLILEEFWQENRELQKYPIYYTGALAKKCMRVYQTYVSAMNQRIRDKAKTANPFAFHHIEYLQRTRDFDDSRPCVVMASPGMLQSGFSRELFERFADNRNNGCVIAGYSVQGTLAYELKTEPADFVSMSGLRLPLRMSVHYVQFSAHADCNETQDFIATLKPPHVVLVHGERNQLVELRRLLLSKYTDGSIKVMAPENCQTVEIETRSRKEARVRGRLGEGEPVEGAAVSGLLLHRHFQYELVAPEDLADMTQLTTSAVEQYVVVPFSQSPSFLAHFLAASFTVEATTVSAAVLAEIKEHEKAAAHAAALKAEQAEQVSDPRARARRKKRVKTEQEADGGAAAGDGGAGAGGGGGDESVYEPIEGAAVLVQGCVRVTPRQDRTRRQQNQEAAHNVVLEWVSTPVADMIADAVMGLLMFVESSPGAAKTMGEAHHHHHHHSHGGDEEEKQPAEETTTMDVEAGEEEGGEEEKEEEERGELADGAVTGEALEAFLGEHFPSSSFAWEDGRRRLRITVDEHAIVIDALSLAVSCEDDAELAKSVHRTLRRIRSAVAPHLPLP